MLKRLHAHCLGSREYTRYYGGGSNSLRFYTNLENLHVWTKYSGYDPEVSVANGQRAITSANLDYGAYPRTLNVTLGASIQF